jgi:Predicted metal-dependent hydrolase with the TIM-barrel fold
LLLASVLIPLQAAAAETGNENAADLILLNARVYTGNAARTWEEALAVRDGKIFFVGTSSGAAKFKGEKSKVLDLAGKMVMPSFCDSHTHLIDGGIDLTECSLLECKNSKQILETITKYAREHPQLPWIRGSGWSLPCFPGGNPTASALDVATGDRPAYFDSQDYHSAWVNNRALQISSITKDTDDPKGGHIERDRKSGKPSGTLRESAMELVARHLPARSAQVYADGLEKGQALANQFGITSIQDAMATPEILAAYAAAEKAGKLKLKVRGAQKSEPDQDDEKQIAEMLELRRSYSQLKRLNAGTVKIFADGVIEAHTAALLEPYSDRKGESGELNFESARLEKLVSRLDKEGFQIHVHAIGDKAVRTALDAFEKARLANGATGGRHHIAHLELIDPADLKRFRTLGVTATIQPFWAQKDDYISQLTEPLIGPVRSERVYTFGSLCNNAAVLAAGSDWPVSSLNPLDAIEVAVTRKAPGATDGKPWLPEERIDLASCLSAYTIGGAYVNHRDGETGSLEVGKAADFIVLDQNLFDVSPDKIHATNVLLTFLDGEEVFRHPGFKD